METIMIVATLLMSHVTAYVLGRMKGYEEGEDSMADVTKSLRVQLDMYKNKEGF